MEHNHNNNKLSEIPEHSKHTQHSQYSQNSIHSEFSKDSEHLVLSEEQCSCEHCHHENEHAIEHEYEYPHNHSHSHSQTHSQTHSHHHEFEHIPLNPFSHSLESEVHGRIDIDHYLRENAEKPYHTQVNHPPSNVEKMLDRYHYFNVIHSIATYQKFQDRFCQSVWNSFMDLNEQHQHLVNFNDTIMNPMVESIEKNNHLLQSILMDYQEELNTIQLIQNSQLNLGFSINQIPSYDDRDKLISTIKQCVRDWSVEGKAERDQCYKPILQELEERFPSTTSNGNSRSNIRVLSPGSGLGRLPYEITKLGFSSEGNEFSYFMLVFSNFFLNCVDSVEEYEIYPWVNSRSNLKQRNDQFVKYKIPDEIPSQHLTKFDGEFSMSAGDFIELYSQQEGRWDAICTCFFIDTAKNIFEYIETIRKALKDDGIWINLGPLLYHFAGMDNYFSVELSNDELLNVIEKLGFVIEKQHFVNCFYTSRNTSMLQQSYDCSFFVARKVKIENK